MADFPEAIRDIARGVPFILYHQTAHSASVMASRIDPISLPHEDYRAWYAGRRPMSMAR